MIKEAPYIFKVENGKSIKTIKEIVRLGDGERYVLMGQFSFPLYTNTIDVAGRRFPIERVRIDEYIDIHEGNLVLEIQHRQPSHADTLLSLVKMIRERAPRIYERMNGLEVVGESELIPSADGKTRANLIVKSVIYSPLPPKGLNLTVLPDGSELVLP